MLKPLWENQAKGKTKTNYHLIKQSLASRSLPIFFAYFGNFPDYLEFITKQIINNIKNPKFNRLSQEIKTRLLNDIKNIIADDKEITWWIKHNRYHPSFYNFQKDLEAVFVINIKLGLVFIGLREAVKGWAIAAKKLPDTSKRKKNHPINQKTGIKNRFIDQIVLEIKENLDLNQEQTAIEPVKKKLFKRETTNRLDKEIMIDYLNLIEASFLLEMRKESFWVLRVNLEKLFLNSLGLLPELIFSPINITLNLIKTNPDYPDFLYLLCEDFPTLAVHRVIFSGYMVGFCRPSF